MKRSLGLSLLNPVEQEYLFTAERGESAEMREGFSVFSAGSAVKRLKKGVI